MMQQVRSSTAQLDVLRKRLDAYESKSDQPEKRSFDASNGCITPILPGRPVQEGDHVTGAHNLIRLWPAVQQLLHLANVKLDATYVMNAEDWDEHMPVMSPSLEIPPENLALDTFESATSSTTCSFDSTYSDYDFAVPRRLSVDTVSIASHELRPPTKRCLECDMSQAINGLHRKHLFESYIKHVHIIHPFVDIGYVKKLLDNFGAELERSQGRQSFNSSYDDYNDVENDRPAKRRRMDTDRAVQVSVPSAGLDLHVQETLENALCCLVLALGAICGSKEACPPPSECKLPSYYGPGLHSTAPSMTPSPEVHGRPDYFAGRITMSEPARTPTWEEQSRNEECPSHCPGIEYYDMAKRIMGPHIEGEGLLHAQVFLLAGLYQSQIGKVKESMKWITMAGRTSLALLRRHKLLINLGSPETVDVVEGNMQARRQMRLPMHDLIVVAAWSCLQLESDVLAELPLPSSGILAYEENIPWPFRIPNAEDQYNALPRTGSSVDDLSSFKVLVFYTSQLWLRKRLNLIQKQLYGDSCLFQPAEQLRGILEEHQAILDSWRKSLPELLQWSDHDPPANDILAARLRAKYYGAYFLANRPFLDYMLHVAPNVNDVRDIRTMIAASGGPPRREAEMQLFEAIYAMPPAYIRQAARRCIEAAIQSTRAFDGILHQLIVTNIHGTAHA